MNLNYYWAVYNPSQVSLFSIFHSVLTFQLEKHANDVSRQARINGESKRKKSSFEALFFGEECTNNFAPDHGEEKVFLDHADFRE